MAEAKVSSSARVLLTLEIDGVGSWGPSCSIDQVHQQAAETAIGMIGHLLEKDRTVFVRARIVGTPKVTAILVAKET